MDELSPEIFDWLASTCTWTDESLIGWLQRAHGLEGRLNKLSCPMPCTTCHFFVVACSAFCAAFLFLDLFLCAALSALVFLLYCTFPACPRDEQVAVLLVSGLLVLIAAAAATAAAAAAAAAE